MAKVLMDSTFDDVLGNVFEIVKISMEIPLRSVVFVVVVESSIGIEQKIIKLSKRVTIKEILWVLYAFDAQPLW